MGVPLTGKLYYKIGEVARMAGVRTSVLRFWETEFDFLKPEKSTTGQRLYSMREVDLVLQVRRLLYDEKFTIEGVRQRVTPKGRLKSTDDLNAAQEAHVDLKVVLTDIKAELLELRRQL